MDVPQRTIAFSVYGPIAPSDLDGLCARVCSLFTGARPSVALCDVHGVGPDAVTVDALARLQLAARRFGCRVYLVRASNQLIDLVGLMGLRDVLPGDSAVEARRQTEERKQPLG